MYEKTSFESCLASSKRYPLYSGKLILRCKTFIGLVLGIVSFGLSALILSERFDFVGIILSGTIVMTAALIWYFLVAHLHTIALKGDTMILNTMLRKSLVTSVNSVRKVSSKSILGIQFTRMEYILDRRERRVLVLGSPDSNELISNIIQQTKSWSKEKKANHKPGSVLAS